jgi:hypothetical protein
MDVNPDDLARLRDELLRLNAILERAVRELQKHAAEPKPEIPAPAPIAHSAGCYLFGPRHYSCALREINRLKEKKQ